MCQEEATWQGISMANLLQFVSWFHQERRDANGTRRESEIFRLMIIFFDQPLHFPLCRLEEVSVRSFRITIEHFVFRGDHCFECIMKCTQRKRLFFTCKEKVKRFLCHLSNKRVNHRSLLFS